MKIKMNVTAAGPKGVYPEGQVVDVDDEDAEAFIEGGYAEEVRVLPVPQETAAAPPPDETRGGEGGPEEGNDGPLPEGVEKTRGGWFRMPGGQKVQGRGAMLDAAQEAEGAGE